MEEKKVYYISGSNELADYKVYIKYLSSILVRLEEEAGQGRLEDVKTLLEITIRNIDTNRKLGNIIF